jgi:hypothetical protein
MVRARLKRLQPGETPDDPILVLEIGEDFSGRGFSRAWTWLQHH